MKVQVKGQNKARAQITSELTLITTVQDIW